MKKLYVLTGDYEVVSRHMAEARCDTCRQWGAVQIVDGDGAPRENYRCALLALMYTRADFGCALWEQKP